MKEDLYIVKVRQKDGTTWVFEGTVQGMPIYVEERQAKPLLMSRGEAEEVQLKYVYEDETFLIERA